MIYAVLADTVGIVHALFVLFVVGGQFLILTGWAVGWRWTRRRNFRRLHLLAIGLVIAISAVGYLCPLTAIEASLRARAGEAGMAANGFIAHWLERLLYYRAPGWVFTTVYAAFAALVALTYKFYPPRDQTEDQNEVQS